MSDKPEAINFDSAPPLQVAQYDDLVSKFVPGYDTIFQLALAYFRAELPTNAALLIVGAGSGKELVTFGQAVPSWRLTGVDPSAHMLALAWQKIAQHSLTQQVTLHHGLVEELPATARFDAATCILVMHFLPDDGTKLAFLSSIATRLRANAPLVLVDIYGGRSFVKQFGSTWVLHGEQMGMSKEVMQEMEKAHGEFYPISEARTLELFEQAGFTNAQRFYTALIYSGWIVARQP